MGANQSGEVSSNYLKEFSHHFQFLKEQNDPRFGLIRVYKKKDSDEEVMIVKKMYTSDEEYNYFQKELNLRSGFQHKNLLQLLGYQRESNANLCGHSRLFEIYSEYHSHNLKKEIQKRTSNLDFFSEAELWYLAESCINVGAFLQERNIYHGDWRPINIMLSDDGYVKIPDNGLLTTIRNNYYKTYAGECRAFLSPELLRAYAKGESNPKYNVFKADVFSLGMTLLHASSLMRPNTHFYDWSNYQMNIRGISEQLKGAEARYSSSWRELLDFMLGIGRDEEQRPDFRALFPLKIGPPKPQEQEYIQPPVYVPQELPPLNKGSELKLIQTDIIEERRLDYQPSQYQERYYQQVPSQIYSSQLQSQPQQNIYQSNLVYQQQQPIQYVQEQPVVTQPPVNQTLIQSTPLYSQSAILQPAAFEQIPQAKVYNPQTSAFYGASNYTVNRAPIVQQQYVGTSQIGGGYEIPNQQFQYGEIQQSYIQRPVSYIAPQQQAFVYEGGGNQRAENVKRSGPPIIINQVYDEKIGRIEDDDLDRRIKEAMRNTQETIDKNNKMESQAVRYQYRNI